MKPRTKFEKAVLAGSKHLRPIAKTQCKWAFRKCIEYFAYRLSKRLHHFVWIVDIVGQWKSRHILAPGAIAKQVCRSGKPLNAR